MGWSSFSFYTQEYLHGDTPLIPEQSFPRWAAAAVAMINRKNLEFANMADHDILLDAEALLFILQDDGIDVGSDDPDAIEEFINEQLLESDIDAEASVVIVNGTYELTIVANTLTDVYAFVIDDTTVVGEYRISGLELMSEEHYIADDDIQKAVCAVSEILYEHNVGTAGRTGLVSESNMGYSWAGESSKDAAAALTAKVREALRIHLAQSEWREYFYFFGRSLLS